MLRSTRNYGRALFLCLGPSACRKTTTTSSFTRHPLAIQTRGAASVRASKKPPKEADTTTVKASKKAPKKADTTTVKASKKVSKEADTTTVKASIKAPEEVDTTVEASEKAFEEAETTTVDSSKTLPKEADITTVKASGKAAPARKTRSRKHYYVPTNPLDYELYDTGVWRTAQSKNSDSTAEKKKKRGGTKSSGDKSRINITSQPLVKDIISYLGPTLERHKGCDLISLYPGAGLWTKALHDHLKPRSHLLLETDEELYKPFLEPLLEQEGVRLVPKSGIVWKDLEQILTPEYLPHQKEVNRDPNTPVERNDTLLISANLAMYPKKKYQLFESLSRLVTYQLISSMRTSTLFQQYGRVRMLLWLPADEREAIIPRTLHGRRRLATEGELFTEYMAEVCGPDGVFTEEGTGWSVEPDPAGKSNRRWGQLDLESVRLAMIRMKEQGIVTPPGRETRLMKQFRDAGRDLDTPLSPAEWVVTLSKKAQKEYDAMAEIHEKTPFDRESKEWARFKMIKNYLIWRDKNEGFSFDMFVRYHEVREAFIAASRATDKSEGEQLLQKAQAMEQAFDRECGKIPKYLKLIVSLGRDQSRMLWHQPPHMGPVLTWDRRPYEPLPVTPQDFYPHVPCCLIDLQPGEVPVSLRNIGPGTDNSGAVFDLLFGVLLQRPREQLAEQLDILWPGANDEIVPQLTSLADPDAGGTPLTGEGALTCRMLNRAQLLQLLEKFMAWPFRPTFSDLVGRLSEERFGEETGEEDDGVHGHASPDSF